MLGAAIAGESALVVALTDAAPEVATYPNTTWTPTPGMMLVDNAPVQLVDTPPLDRDFNEPELFDLIRRADLVLVMGDPQPDALQQLEDVRRPCRNTVSPCTA